MTFWSEFCDWYIEMAKIDLYGENEDKKDQHSVWLVLDQALRLHHPFYAIYSQRRMEAIFHIREKAIWWLNG